MKEEIKFIHCADLHLDSPFQGFFDLPESLFDQVQESTFRAFERIIEQAIHHQVDFVAVVGDLFDQDVRSLKAQVRLRKGFEKLQAHGVQVYVSHGNHDHLGGSFYAIDYPENVHIFTNQEVTSFPYYKDGEQRARLYGFSYEQKAVTEPKADEFTPLPEDVLHIGMLHGSLATNTDHDVYAPFRIEELQQRGMDYWALGHIHKTQKLSEEPPIVYSGNIQGRHRNEPGERGCYLVELNETGHSLQFLPTHSICFKTQDFDIKSYETLAEVEKELEHVKAALRKDGSPVLLHLKMNGALPDHDSHMPHLTEELRQLWNEGEEDRNDWIWIHKISETTDKRPEHDQLAQGSHFVGELLRTLEATEEIQEDIVPLTQHHALRKYVGDFSDEETDDIIQQAEELLLHELVKEGE